jgi:hypothetical protein
MMTTSSTHPQWLLIDVRVCASSLALLASAYPVLVFISVTNGTFAGAFGLPLLMLIPGVILFGLTALKLWVLRPWARAFASKIFVFHTWGLLHPFIILFTSPSKVIPGDFLSGTIWAVIGIISRIFLRRPAVKALFENQSHVDFF